MALKCSNCKSYIKKGDVFCGSCGAELSAEKIIDTSVLFWKSFRKFCRKSFKALIALIVIYIVILSIDSIVLLRQINKLVNNDLENIHKLRDYHYSDFPFFQRSIMLETVLQKKALEKGSRQSLENALYVDDYNNYSNQLKEKLTAILLEHGPKPSKEGKYIDPRDNKEYTWLMIGRQIWMAKSISYTGVSHNEKEDIVYPPAVIDRVAPPGWRVPSDSDWQVLEKLLGHVELDKDENRYYDDRDMIDRAKYEFSEFSLSSQLSFGGSTNLNMSEGYWTSSQVGKYKIYTIIGNEYYRKEVTNRNNYEYSIRCVTDLSPEKLELIYAIEKKRIAETLYSVFDTYKDIKDPYLNLRESPGTRGRILYKLVDGDIVEVLEKDVGPYDVWYKIRFPANDVIGYVHRKYLKKI